MKLAKMSIPLLVSLLCATSLFAQTRRSQTEIYTGAAFPLGPDWFKDFYKIGLSGNVQYVLFPSQRLGIPIFVGYEGFTVDANAIANASAADLVGRPILDASGNPRGTVINGNIDATGSASAIKFGIGARPYLTRPESSTQFFLFGTATYNFLMQKTKINGGEYTGRDFLGNVQTFPITNADIVTVYGGTEFEVKPKKFGLTAGGGFELPAGESLNLILQGLFNIIFTDTESTTFLGVTAGVVF
ncbi:MAG: hypothetical protein ACREOO_02520 [bacterium]